MQTTHPLIDHPTPGTIVPFRVTQSESETMRAHTGAPSDERAHEEMHAVADRDRMRSAHSASRQAEQLVFLRNELMLMTLQTREIQQCGDQMLQATDMTLDTQRDLLHLCTRIEGILWQLKDMIRVSERLMSHPPPGHPVPETDRNDDLPIVTHENHGMCFGSDRNRAAPRSALNEATKANVT